MIINVRGQAARRRAQAAVNRQQALLEPQFARRVRVALDGQRKAAARAVLAGEDPVAAADLWNKEVARALRKGYYVVAESFLQLAGKSLDGAKATSGPPESKGIMAELFWAAFAEFVQAMVAEKVVQVSETTRAAIRAIVELGRSEGMSARELAKEIWSSTGRDINRRRALRIARTEVHGASSYATDAAIRSARLRGMTREWIAMADERTRSSHREAHGQVRGMDEPFDIPLPRGEAGTERLMFPGDPSGSAGNVINCRCVLIYHTHGSAERREAARRRERRRYEGMGEAWA